MHHPLAQVAHLQFHADAERGGCHVDGDWGRVSTGLAEEYAQEVQVHTVRVGAVELSAQDENRYGVPNLELLCQVLQLQPQVRPLPGLPVDKAEYERTRCR